MAMRLIFGYEFLRTVIAENDYRARGCEIEADEIFVSDGAKSDSANIQELFSEDNRIAVCDPVYPVYVDSNVMAGRTGTYDAKSGKWSNVIYMPCTMENNFVPEFPKETPDLFICVCQIIQRVPRLREVNCRHGWIMQTGKEPSSFMMRLTRHIFLKKTSHILFMSARERRHVQSRLGAFLKMRDLQACGLVIRWCQSN